MNNKFLTLLGFAAKSGNLSYGMSASAMAVKTKKSKLIIVCSDISPKSKKEITFQAQKTSIRVFMPDDYNIETVSGAVGRRCGILSVNDSSFADAILKAAETNGGNAYDK